MRHLSRVNGARQQGDSIQFNRACPYQRRVCLKQNKQKPYNKRNMKHIITILATLALATSLTLAKDLVNCDFGGETGL
jgi:hypothetical protein